MSSHQKLYIDVINNPACINEVIDGDNQFDQLSLVALLPRLPGALDIALKLLHAKYPSVRIALVGYLHRIRESYYLCERLATDGDGNVRWAVAKAVHEMPFGAEIAKYMVINEPCETCLWTIARQLPLLSNGGELAELLLTIPAPEVREQVFKVLGKLDSGQALALKVAHSGDQNNCLMLSSNINSMPNVDELEPLLKKRGTRGVKSALTKQLQIRQRLAAGLPATGSFDRYANPYDMPVYNGGGRVKYRRRNAPFGGATPLR